jgi:hypothetical protein
MDLVEAVLAGSLTVARVRGFLSPSAALQIGERLAASGHVGTYRNMDQAVFRLGESHYETLSPDGSTDGAQLDEYLSSAPELDVLIRRICHPSPHPLDEFWSYLGEFRKCEIAKIDGRPMFAGIVRFTPDGAQVLPHNDVFRRDAPDLPLAREVRSQIGVNLYLQMPGDGGRLQFWDWQPSDLDLRGIEVPESGYGIDRSKIPPPCVEMTPVPGDLYLLSSSTLHAVAPVRNGLRVNVNAFLAELTDSSLIYWS